MMRNNTDDRNDIIYWLVLLACGAAAIVLIVLLQFNSGKASQYQRINKSLAALNHVELIVVHDALRILSGELKNYDRISAAKHETGLQLERLQHLIKVTEGHDSERSLDQLGVYVKRFERRSELVERFKSDAAVLNNAMDYVPFLVEELLPTLDKERNGEQLTLEIRDYNRKLLRAYMTRSENDFTKYRDQAKLLESLIVDQQDDVSEALDILIKHGHALTGSVKSMGSTLEQLQSLNGDGLLDQLDRSISAHFEEFSERGKLYRIALIVMLAIMFIYMIYFILVLTGTKRSLSATLIDLKDANTEIESFNATLEKRIEERTSQLKSAHEELKANQLKLVQAERLSALGQVSATMSHEIRNPLGAIRTALYIIREMAAKAKLNLDRPINRAERSVARCDNIVGDFLEYTRTKELTIESVDASDFLTALLAEQVLPNSIEFKLDVPVPGPQIAIDPERFRRVIINLVDNAAQAIKDSDAESGEINVSCHTQGDGTVISVRDNGPGIPDDVLPRIFDPLFTTKSFGAGLGLATVKQLLEQHDAELKIDTEVGVGTTFNVILPSASVVMAAGNGKNNLENAA